MLKLERKAIKSFEFKKSSKDQHYNQKKSRCQQIVHTPWGLFGLIHGTGVVPLDDENILVEKKRLRDNSFP